MPTRVDVAAEAAHEEISKVVKKIESSLESQSRSDGDDELPSPLFREEEVQHQEMRYLDRLLLGKKPASKDGLHQSRSSRPATGDGKHCQYKERFGGSPQVHRRTNRSKIASILSPHNRTDDVEKKQVFSGVKESYRSQRQEETQNIHNKKPDRNKSNRSNTPNHSQGTTISRKLGLQLHEKMSGLVRRAQSGKNSKRHTQNKKHAHTAAPSRNKRRQMNHKVIQRAQRSSRRLIGKMVRLGRRCTHNLTTIRNAIKSSVAKAVAHTMLEENIATSGVPNANGGEHNSNVHGNMKVKKLREAGGLGGNKTKETGKSSIALSSQSQSSVPPIPPNGAFVLASSLVLRRTERMSSKAVSTVHETTHL